MQGLSNADESAPSDDRPCHQGGIPEQSGEKQHLNAGLQAQDRHGLRHRPAGQTQAVAGDA